MHRTNALTFDPAAAQAWLHQPSAQFADLTRAEGLGVDDELTGPGVEGFLATVDEVLAAQPDGLHCRADVSGVELWHIPDGDVLDQGALVTVDTSSNWANGVRLATLHQDIKDFANRDQRGVPAVLSALRHTAHQASLVVEAYEAAYPNYAPELAVSR